MTYLSIAAGMAVLTVLLVDVFSTVFVPGGGAGVVTSRLYRLTWALWRRIGGGSPRRRRLLSLAGPCLLLLTVAVWIAELVLGYALIYLPFTAELSATPDSTAESPAWATALYLSGSAATTVGMGDVHATTWPLRLVTVLEATWGFALFTVSISYLLGVYGGVTRTRSLAWAVHRFVRRGHGGDPVELVIRTVRSGGGDQLTDWFGSSTAQLHHVMQDEAQYPLMQYFHSSDDDAALPLALPALFEVVTLVRSLLNPEDHRRLVSGPVTLATYGAAVGYQRSRLASLPAAPRTDDEAMSGHREQRYRTARSRLQAAGVTLRDDAEAELRYVDLRSSWDTASAGVRRHFRYPDDTA